jgi:exodeoxyribonuclease VIII
MMDVMIDLETFGTRPNAQIVQIGAVAFEAQHRGRVFNGKGFNRFTMVQEGAGTVDHGTLGFWIEQVAKNPSHPIVNGMAEAVPLRSALVDLLSWPGEVFEGSTWANVRTVWAKPSNFDLSVLASAFANVLGVDPPWDHRSTRCARTLFHLTGGEPTVDWTGLVPHDALDDAIGQAMQVQVALGPR